MVNIPEQKLVELAKQLTHTVRTNVTVDTDSKGTRKPKITIEIERETEDGSLETVKKLVLEQLDFSKDVIIEKLNEMDLVLNPSRK